MFGEYGRIIARMMMSDTGRYQIGELKQAYDDAIAKATAEHDAEALKGLAFAAADTAGMSPEEMRNREEHKSILLENIMRRELDKPAEEMDTKLVDEIVIYLDSGRPY